jgi:pimeloyl-ACP methyl ester carboxylesterase
MSCEIDVLEDEPRSYRDSRRCVIRGAVASARRVGENVAMRAGIAAELEPIEIETSAGAVHAIAREGDRPLVFVHGLGASSAYFADAGERAEIAGRGVVALDLPGFGRTEARGRFGFTMREHAAVLAQAIEALDLARVTLVGHSMGGTIAMRAVPALRERLEAVVVVEGVLLHDAEIWSEQIARMAPEAWAVEYEKIRRRPTIYARAGMLRLREEAIRRVAPAVTQTSAHAMQASARAMQASASEGSLYASFLALDLPHLYLFGEIHATTWLYRKMLRDEAPIALVARSGHLMMLDNPGGFYKAVGGV